MSPQEFSVQGPGGGVGGGPHAAFKHSANGLVLTFTDTSTATAPATIAAVTVSWGDGTSSTLTGGSQSRHTYPSSGSYRIVQIVTDSKGLTDEASSSVSVSTPSTGGGGGSGGGGGGTGGGGGGSTGGGSTGGGSNVTGPFTVTTQSQTIQQLTSGQVLDVELVGFQTIPHGVYSQVYVPITDWANGNSGGYIAPVATAIEALLSLPHVTTANYVQDVDATTNLLTGYEAFTVSYTPAGSLSGMTTTVRIPVSTLANGATGAPTDAVNAAYAQLQATAGR